MSNRCYIKSVALVSCQKPLSDEWFTAPEIPDKEYVRAQEPDSREFIVPSEARRMSKILKRTICTSISALNKAGLCEPDAIITGTGNGCMENSEKFLIDLSRYGESCLKPTLFMQSTHNTISSLIAIVLKCHGYNNTYSHKHISFESSLLDGWLQVRGGMARNVLVGSHDEVTPFMSLVLKRTHPEYNIVSETSMASVVSSDPDGAICEVSDVTILHRAGVQQVARYLEDDDNLLLLGTNGLPGNDAPYDLLLQYLDEASETLQYKHIFGENFSVSAAAFCVAATILEKQEIPACLWRGNALPVRNAIKGVTILNCSEDSTWSIVKLKRNYLCGG